MKSFWRTDRNKEMMFFAWIAEPRHFNILMAFSYFCVGLCGFLALVDQKNIIFNNFGQSGILWSTTWATFMTVAGCCGIIGSLLGFWQVERIGIMNYFVSIALIYVGVFSSTQFNNEALFLIISTTLALCLTYWKRWLHIKGADLDPTKLLNK